MRTFYQPHDINADLHCHSQFSDGILSVSHLLERAAHNGVQMLALTDHDELIGLNEASHIAADLHLSLVPGVEISVSWGSATIHVLGLQIDPTHEPLRQGLAQTRQGRDQRARDIAASLEKSCGIAGVYEGALRFAANPDMISRSHFARFLVEKGICKDVRSVFGRYLTQGKPGYVETRWAALKDALEWIHGAGGVAIVAHPGRYSLSANAREAFFDEFKQLGGEGVEVVTASHTTAQYHEFAKLAKNYDFMASRGSDFHGPEESRIDLGNLPPLPDSVVPIWHDWPARYPAWHARTPQLS